MLYITEKEKENLAQEIKDIESEIAYIEKDKDTLYSYINSLLCPECKLDFEKIALDDEERQLICNSCLLTSRKKKTWEKCKSNLKKRLSSGMRKRIIKLSEKRYKKSLKLSRMK